MVFKSERAFQKSVERECKVYGWDYYHISDSRTVSAACGKGFPDLVIMRPPYLMFVELKLEHNQPTDDQKRWIIGLRNCGQESFVLTPNRFEEFISVLRHPQLDGERWISI